MPNKDKTGPEGKGPKTGRQSGDCEGKVPSGNSFACTRGFKEARRCCRRGTINCIDKN